jgi:hypothetical protein
VVIVTASLLSGRTLSLWPVDGRILDQRTLQPRRYWLSVGFYAFMATFSLWGAWFVGPALPTKPPAGEPTPIMIAAITIVPLGLNIVYYRMKSKAADKTAWRRFWFVGWVLMLPFVVCPEVLSLRLPSPLWKVALIPVLALAFSSFNVAVSGAFGGAKKS